MYHVDLFQNMLNDVCSGYSLILIRISSYSRKEKPKYLSIVDWLNKICPTIQRMRKVHIYMKRYPEFLSLKNKVQNSVSSMLPFV